MKVFACYIRASTEEYHQAGQRREINRWLKSNRIHPKHVRWYIDQSSGNSSRRPGFDALRTDLSGRQIGTVVVSSLGRLSPTMRDGLRILCEWSRTPLRFVSVKQRIDFKGGASSATAFLLDGLAQMAYETKREQSRIGLAAARAKGRFAGRPEVTAQDAKVIKAKKLERDGKLSVSDICTRLKISPSTYYRYVSM